MKTILVIEDDAVVRENTAEILTLAQYQVVTAPNGKEGVRLAKTQPPDLIVCDIMMPELDGYGVLQILAKEPATAKIPFIFLTAKAEKSELRKGMELGADDYLTKPFEETELLSAIEARLQRHRILTREFASSLDGLTQFLNEARGLKDLASLSQHQPMVRYKKKEAIFREGEEPTCVYFLQSGRVKTYKGHDEGRDYVTSVFSPGEFFGYAPLLEQTPYPEAAEALEACELCRIPKQDFLALLYKNRDVAGCFIKLLANRVASQEEQLLRMAYDSVRKRVAHALLQLMDRYQRPGQQPVRLTVSREDLAGMVGTATETAIRCLSDFKANESIAVEGREIVILDAAGLREIR